jgi:hypothetical protein
LAKTDRGAAGEEPEEEAWELLKKEGGTTPKEI